MKGKQGKAGYNIYSSDTAVPVIRALVEFHATARSPMSGALRFSKAFRIKVMLLQIPFFTYLGFEGA